MDNLNVKTDFDIDKDVFYLNYFANDLKGWFCIELDKDEVDVISHWDDGDFYSSDNDSGCLPGGYYDEGFEIDDITIPTKYTNEHFYDKDDNEISKEEFLQLNNLSEESLKSYLKKAKRLLSSKIEDYVDDNIEEYVESKKPNRNPIRENAAIGDTLTSSYIPNTYIENYEESGNLYNDALNIVNDVSTALNDKYKIKGWRAAYLEDVLYNKIDIDEKIFLLEKLADDLEEEKHHSEVDSKNGTAYPEEAEALRFAAGLLEDSKNE